MMKGTKTHPRKHQLQLIVHLVRREFILRYKGSALGMLWYLILPLLQLFILVFVFGKVIPLGIESYPAFVYTGLLSWTWFSNSLNVAGGLFIGNRDLVRRPNFNPHILVAVSALANFMVYLVSLPLVIALLIFQGHMIAPSALLLPLIIVIQAMLIIGLGLLISTWNAFYRDVQQIVTVLLPLLFYVTPVFYRTQVGKQHLSFLYDWNPITILVWNHRKVLFYGTAPDWASLGLGFVLSSLILGLGWYTYNRKIGDVIDIV